MKYIIGIGNYSMFDDSIGIRVIEEISEKNLEDGFRALDLSSNALSLVSYLNEDTKKILVVDTAYIDGLAPGEFKFFTLDQVRSVKTLDGFSTHEGDIVATLELAKTMGYPTPKVTFMGIRPQTIKNDFGLSEILQINLRNYVSAAIQEINKD